MRRQALESLRSAIEANTERRSIDQLKAQGKRHVRVVSSQKVLQIIKAIVSDIVDREVGELSARDRERIVGETKDQFDRVMKMQSDQDGVIAEQKELVSEYRAKYEQAREEAQQWRSKSEQATKLSTENERLMQTLEDARSRAQEREDRLKAEHKERLEELNSEQRELIARLEGERGSLAGKQEAALQSAQTRIGDLEERLSGETGAKATLQQRADAAETARSKAEEKSQQVYDIAKELEVKLEGARVTCENYDKELTNLVEERDELRVQLAELRERAGESDAVAQLRNELSDMRGFLQNIEEKSGSVNADTLESLVDKMSQRDAVNTSVFEDKLNASLDASLDKITKTMELATAKPIDVVVEATDVLVAKLFDYDTDVMSSNMEDLDVEETTTKSNIAGNLEALRAMRSGQTPTHDEPDPADEVADLLDDALDDTPLSDSDTTAAKGEHHGTEAELEEVSASAKEKISASMERLKAARQRDENE